MEIIEDTIKNYIQKKAGEVLQSLLKDVKIKSFHSIQIEIAEISIKSNNFKIKVIDKSTGKPISDIPIPINTKIKIKPIVIEPNMDIMLGKKK